MNILALMAHHEDTAFLCAGTLLKYKELGHKIYIAVATEEISPDGANELGAEVRFLGFKKDAVKDDMISRAAVLTAIRWANADIIITHAPWDADSDHAITSKLAADSLLIVGGKLHPADLPPIDKLPHLFYTDTLAGNYVENRYLQRIERTTDQTFYLTPGVYSNSWTEPETYVDISMHMAQKREMLKDAPTLSQGAETQNRIRGIQMGVQYAEGFTGHRIVGHIADYRLLP